VVDALGARDGLVRTRDRLVDLLTGNQASPGVRRNSKDDFHLKLLLRFSLKTTSNYLDVGANHGHFLQDLTLLAPQGHHIAYEPLTHLYSKLVQRFPNVEMRQAALSDQDAEVPFTHVLGAGKQGYSTLVDNGSTELTYPSDLETRTISVRTERLDDHLPDGWLPDIVKIDVEGAERLVFRGAMDTFRRSKPVIAFEHIWDPEGSEEIYRLVSEDLGLRIFDMDGHGPFDRPQFFEELVSRWNWVAHE
jgi:FkbM family methyltransferase